YSVDDNRLKNILQEFVILKARYGEFNLNNTLRGADTISNHIYNLADECRTQFNEIIHEPLGSGAIYVSPDLWSDNHRKISYLGMIATFVDDKFRYYIVDLSCKPFIGDNQGAENLLIDSMPQISFLMSLYLFNARVTRATTKDGTSSQVKRSS
ncbi:unnamed protein product, partial [Rotaria sordida]